MTKMLKIALVSAALAAGCWIAPAQAQALSANINGVTCLDGQAGCDADGIVNNQITWLASVSGFSISTTISFTNSPGVPGNSFLDMTFAVFATPTGGGLITLGASASGFTVPVTGAPSVLTSDLAGNIGGPAGSTVSGQSFMNALSPGPQALQTITHLNFVSATPYTLSQLMTINLVPTGFTTGDFKTEVVPEPAPLALLAIALGALALVRRRTNA